MSLVEIVRVEWGFAGLDPADIIDVNAFGNVLVQDTQGRYWRICPEELSCGLVASSAHIFAIYVRIGNAEVDRDKQSAAVSALGFDKLQWRAPVRPGDVLRSAYTVISARVSESRPTLGVVTTRCRMFNQRGETVFTLECSYLIERRSDVNA